MAPKSGRAASSPQSKKPLPGGKKTARELMNQDLQRSGIRVAEAKLLRYEPLTPAEVGRLTELSPRLAYRIPYLDPAGQDTGFLRLRFLGDSSPGKKSLRYWQPAGSLPRLYFPRVATLDLAAALRDPQEPLHITEGEKKSVAGCLASLATIAVGGVWAWRSKKRADTKTLAIPDLDLIEWRDRRVIFVFDSDVSTKPDVQDALRAFAREVMGRGARPYSIKLPSGPGGAKVGLDDFLLAEGRAAFDALEPEPLLGRLADELWRLNEEIAYVKENEAVWRFENRRFLTKDQLNLAYANRLVTLVDSRGSVKQECVVKEWLKWSQRKEAPCVAFEPGEATVLSDGEINLWRGWGVEPVAGSTKPWDDLLSYLFAGNQVARGWFEDWCAWPLQHPGAKLYSAAVLFSLRHGVGKSLVGFTLGKIYGEAFVLLSQEELASPFNPWAAGKCFALGDEVTGTDKRRDADRFKTLVTREVVTVNAKFQPQYTVPDRLNYLFTTNHPDAFILERDDRRFFIHEVEGDPLNHGFYDTYDEWLRGAGPSHLFHRLLKRNLRAFNPKAAPPRTDARAAMVELSFSDLDQFADRLREDPDALLRLDGQVVDRSLLTLEELLLYADPGGSRRTTRVALAKALRRAGFKPLDPVRLTDGVTRLWAVRDQERWLKAPHAALKAERERGQAREGLAVIRGGKKF